MAGGSFSTPLDGFNITDNSFLWTFNPSINQTNTGFNLTSRINSDAYQVCQGTYCQGALNTIIEQVASGILYLVHTPYCLQQKRFKMQQIKRLQN